MTEDLSLSLVYLCAEAPVLPYEQRCERCGEPRDQHWGSVAVHDVRAAVQDTALSRTWDALDHRLSVVAAAWVVDRDAA
jgi:hypothetical protein